ncbi:RND superfamily drug exporter [Secundilactobacillus malefermentans DSM 5705 = KCTC 3548]|nr:RND superfamily drug exporter [Secundilactobacillus malefermentans DSM 5705 = KCTC 3548]
MLQKGEALTMQEQLHKLHKNRIFSLIVWLVVIFIAIISMPKTSTMIQYYGQPQLSNSSQAMKAAKLKNTWGRELNGTYNVNAVFNNSNGKLTANNKAQISKIVTKLQNKQKYYGIKKITTITNTPEAKNQLVSKDQSTQIVQLAVSRDQGTVRNISKQLYSQVQAAGLKSYVTSPEIINDDNNLRIAGFVQIAAIILFVLAIITMGIIFKSVAAPLISFLTLLISYLASLSISNNLTYRENFPYSEYLPLAILLSTILVGTFELFFLYRRFKQNVAEDAEGSATTSKTIRYVQYPIIAIGVTLTIIFAAFWFLPFSTIRSFSSLAFTFIVLTLAVLTISPIFMGMLEENFFWPTQKSGEPKERHFWNRLARFGMWQPIVAILVVLYVVGPFAYSYHNNLTYSVMNNLRNDNQAAQGAKVLAAHFSQGKASPITVYLKSDKRLDSANSLYQIDNLTTKLKSMPGISSVTSLTQPNGMPISQYYVSAQLTSVTQTLKGATDQLNSIQGTLKDNNSDLSVSDLTKINKSLTKLSTATTKLSTDSSTVQSQVSEIAGRASALQQSSSSSQSASYRRQARIVAAQLQTAATNVQALVNQANLNNTSATTNQTGLDSYQTQVKSVAKSLKASQKSLKNLVTQYNDIYNYLTKLRASDAAKIYFMTPEQIMSPTFQRSVINNTSQNGKMTALTVYMKNSPDSHKTLATTQKLQDEIKTQLQGTSLKKATVAVSGQPMVQSAIQSEFEHYLPLLVLMTASILLLALMLISRSILQPSFWLATFFVSSLAGMQIAHLTMRFMAGQSQFNWQVPVIAIVPLVAIAALQLIPLAIEYRYNEDSLLGWLTPAMTETGQTLRHTLFIGIISVIGLAFLRFNPLTEVMLIVIYTLIIFNIVLPITVTSLGKLTVTVPSKKPHLRRHG